MELREKVEDLKDGEHNHDIDPVNLKIGDCKDAHSYVGQS